jgi:septal ring factor EnvC (AmiA/AmiB activator)
MSEDEASDAKPKGGRARGAENVELLCGYIAELKAAGARLPSHAGQPDKSAIALAAGFERQTFYNNAAARAVLEQAVVDLGLEGDARTVPENRAAHLEHKVDQRERRIKHLEERLATQGAELTELRRENKALKEKLRQYEVAEEVMTTTGRRFRP